MKLRNKKTGEIVEFVAVYIFNGRIFYRLKDEKDTFKMEVNSLAKLNEEWEDVPEESKWYWFIDSDGDILHELCDDGTKFDIGCKQIGNYFKTKEEAERAVEKHKAWSRLKAKGLTWQGWEEGAMDNGMCIVGFQIPEENWDTNVVKDLDICFGGEE